MADTHGRQSHDRHAHPKPTKLAPGRTAFLFDLDGTLVDSVYQHVLAWHEAIATLGIDLAVWTIHRRIGMSGGLMANALLRETGHVVTPEEAARLGQAHAAAFARLAETVRPLPGSIDLLQYLTAAQVPWAIATSGKRPSAQPTLDKLGIPASVPVVTRDQVDHAKPDPDLVLAAAERLGIPISDCVVVGDSIWDLLAARRARALGVGLLSAVMDRTNSNGLGLTAFIRIRPTCSGIWTKSASGRRNNVERICCGQIWQQDLNCYARITV